jgi:hypothetical protein
MISDLNSCDILKEFGSNNPALLDLPAVVVSNDVSGLLVAQQIAGGALAFPGAGYALSAVNIWEDKISDTQVIQAWATAVVADIELQEWENLEFHHLERFSIPAGMSTDALIDLQKSREWAQWFETQSERKSNADVWGLIYKIALRVGFCASALSEGNSAIVIAGSMVGDWLEKTKGE